MKERDNEAADRRSLWHRPVRRSKLRPRGPFTGFAIGAKIGNESAWKSQCVSAWEIVSADGESLLLEDGLSGPSLSNPWRAELASVVGVLEALARKSHCIIHVGNKTIADAFRDLAGKEQRGWTNSQGKQLEGADILQRALDTIRQEYLRIEVVWDRKSIQLAALRAGALAHVERTSRHRSQQKSEKGPKVTA